MGGIFWLARPSKPAPEPERQQIPTRASPVTAPTALPDARHRVQRASRAAAVAAALDGGADAGARVYYDPHELEFLEEIDREGTE